MIKNFRGENWKTVHKEEWYEAAIYKISNYGRIISYRRYPEGELLKGGNINGYKNLKVRLKNRNFQTCYIHRLVAETFLEQGEGAEFVIHKNHKRDDNRAQNLAWVNHEEWVKHQYNSPKVIANKEKRKTRRVVNYSKLSYSQAVILKKKLLDPNRKTRIRVLAKQFGVSEMQLYRIKSGENWGDIEV